MKESCVKKMENYAGRTTCTMGCCLALGIGPCAVLFCIFCPMDQRDVWVAPDGQRYLWQPDVDPNAWTKEVIRKGPAGDGAG